MTENALTQFRPSRRGLIGLAGATAILPVLAACTQAGSGAATSTPGGVIKFWDMPVGETAYNDAAKKLVESYSPQNGLPKVTYQSISWTNYAQTFASALASKTGPAVSAAGAYSAFQFADNGFIAYADNLIDQLKKTGEYDDFLPGTVDALKTPNGYVAVPWGLDVRPIWYRKSLLEKASVGVPTDWDSWIVAGKALKKIGVFGFGIGAGAGNHLGQDALLSLMINNGGGFFDENRKPNCVTDRNIEAMDFLLEMIGQGMVDPGSVSYTSDNLSTQWQGGHFGIGYETPGLDNALSAVGDLMVTDPLKGPHGDQGAIFYVDNLMMYKNSPSQAGSEAFLSWYLPQMKTYWTNALTTELPAFKSVMDSPEYQKQTQNVKILKSWVPISKTWGALSTGGFTALAAVQNAQVVTAFTQTMLQGQTASKTALEKLQTGLEALVK